MMTVVYEVEDGLYVNITNRCTNRCDFCIRRNGEGAYGSDSLWLTREPTVEEICEAIRTAGPDRYREIVFCGYGEPTCRLDDMLAVCREIRKMTRTPIRLNTNGQASLLAGRETAPLFAGCFDTVSISLNEASASRYDALCHSQFGEAAFEALLSFAAAIKPYVPTVVFSVVRQFLSPEALSECERISARLGVPLRIREYVSAEK